MFTVVSLEYLNTAWCSKRVIDLLDETRVDDAEAVAKEWGFMLEEDPILPLDM